MPKQISQDFAKQLLSYNPETGIFTWKVSRGRRANNSIAGAINGRGYICIKIQSETYQAHRLAWLIVHGVWPNGDIDHINGLKIDNKITNLRDVTRSVNKQNTKKAYAGSSSGLLGVSWFKRTRKWQAQIYVNGGTKSLGLYANKEDAHQAYLLAKRRLHEGATI